ncbi:unnamed protein product, partial [Ectocarpus sp. 12 AP-2014]
LWTRGHRASFRQNSTKEAEAEEAAANHRLRWLLCGGGTTPSSSPPGNGNGGEGEGSTDGDRGEAAEGGFSEGKEEGQEAWGQQGSGEDEKHCYFARPGDEFGLGTARTLQSFADRVGVDFRTATVTSSSARNAGRPSADFNDSVASGLEGVLDLLQGNLKSP